MQFCTQKWYSNHVAKMSGHVAWWHNVVDKIRDCNMALSEEYFTVVQNQGDFFGTNFTHLSLTTGLAGNWCILMPGVLLEFVELCLLGVPATQFSLLFVLSHYVLPILKKVVTRRLSVLSYFITRSSSNAGHHCSYSTRSVQWMQ